MSVNGSLRASTASRPGLNASCKAHGGYLGGIGCPQRTYAKGLPTAPLKTIEKVIDDLAKHAVEHHHHAECPTFELRMRGPNITERDQLWWWRGYLTGHMVDDLNEHDKPQWSNAGGATNRLKREWHSGFKVAVREREQVG